MAVINVCRRSDCGFAAERVAASAAADVTTLFVQKVTAYTGEAGSYEVQLRGPLSS